jgi:hypothetical protein
MLVVNVGRECWSWMLVVNVGRGCWSWMLVVNVVLRMGNEWCECRGMLVVCWFCECWFVVVVIVNI